MCYGSRAIAYRLNKAGKTDEWIAQWDQRIADSKTAVETMVGDGTVSSLSPYVKGIYAFGHNYGRGGEILYGEFKLQAPPIIQQEAIGSSTGWASLSLEKLPELTADYLFVTAGGSISLESEFQKALDVVTGVEKLQVWQVVPAVKQDHVYKISARHWMLSGPIADSMKIDDVAATVTGNQ